MMRIILSIQSRYFLLLFIDEGPASQFKVLLIVSMILWRLSLSFLIQLYYKAWQVSSFCDRPTCSVPVNTISILMLRLSVHLCHANMHSAVRLHVNWFDASSLMVYSQVKSTGDLEKPDLVSQIPNARLNSDTTRELLFCAFIRLLTVIMNHLEEYGWFNENNKSDMLQI